MLQTLSLTKLNANYVAYAVHYASMQLCNRAHTREHTMLTTDRVINDDDCVTTIYKCDALIECDGTSIWSNTAGVVVHVTEINAHKYANGYTVVYALHNAGWEIYTDKGFEQGISKLLGYNVSFTEQGMQEDEVASLETC